MMIIFIAVLTIILYFAAAGLQLLNLIKNIQALNKWVISLSLIAIFAHAFLLYRWIDVSTGQNLTFFNTLSQVCWLATVIVWFMAIKRPLVNLGMVVYPLSAISILLVLIFSGSYIVNTKADPKTLLHILLSFLAVSILIIAAIQSIFLALLNRALRNKHPNLLTQSLLPLQKMESLLFQLISLGFFILTAVIISGLSFFSRMYHSDLWHHMLFAIIAWLIFGILLIGRIFFGWRGKIAIRWTLIGVMLLLVAYLSSQFWPSQFWQVNFG